jgi:hypothetical protein
MEIIINFTSSTVSLTIFIMALTKNNFGIYLSHRILQAIENCTNKVGLLKISELLTESGMEGGDNFYDIRTDSTSIQK